jgi:hypothetical protein
MDVCAYCKREAPMATKLSSSAAAWAAEAGHHAKDCEWVEKWSTEAARRRAPTHMDCGGEVGTHSPGDADGHREPPAPREVFEVNRQFVLEAVRAYKGTLDDDSYAEKVLDTLMSNVDVTVSRHSVSVDLESDDDGWPILRRDTLRITIADDELDHVIAALQKRKEKIS